jgi:hypothetical protein
LLRPNGTFCKDAKIVARQRALVARLKEAGHDVSDAEHLLEQFDSSLAIFEDHHRAICKDLGMAVDAKPIGQKV